MTRPHPTRTRGMVTRAALIALTGAGFGLGLSACSDNGDGECVPTDVFFREKVWAPTLAAKCSSCHTSSGAAKHTKFVLTPAQVPGYLEANMKLIQDLARYDVDGTPLILAKPAQRGKNGPVEHGGGLQLAPDSQEYKDLAALLDRFNNPVPCEGQVNLGNYFNEVELLDEVDTLRKATLMLNGRLPHPEEYEAVRGFGIESIDAVLDGVMKEDAFIDQIVEMYNDVFLTDRYIDGNEAVALLNPEKYPNAYWFEAIEDDQAREQARYYTNSAVAREALNLVAYIVKNDRDYREIVTADYAVFTPYSAKAYGASVSFTDPNDPLELQQGKLSDYPHAGVLTSPMWLNRFPTTPTNRSRHRARKIYDQFLATDVLALASQAIDPAAGSNFANPTRDAPECAMCHTVIDPIAGAFQMFDKNNQEFLLATPAWYPEMFAPGFNGEDMPKAEFPHALQWFGARAVQDPRFVIGTVYTVYRALTGQEPLAYPADPESPQYGAELSAWQAQDDLLRAIGDAFVADDYNLKTVIERVIASPYYRGLTTEDEPDADDLVELAAVGTARLSTPELLATKIAAVTGVRWLRPWDLSDYLRTDYKVLYGGIDSDSIIQRLTHQNGIMASVATRMANEVACAVTAYDFSRPAGERALFPKVTLTHYPEDPNGAAVPDAVADIKANIQYLHARILGEELDIADPEIERTYALFLETWEEGVASVAAGKEDAWLSWRCMARVDPNTQVDLPEAQKISDDTGYTVRAWMAVITYLLSDYRFLYE